MSWFEYLKNAAKTVAVNITQTSANTAAAKAIPDTHSGLWSCLDKPSTSGIFSHVGTISGSDSESISVLRNVTTRSRYTYELDRFQKNALLMFVQMKSEPPAGTRVEETTTHDINVLLDTLSGFRFEANTHIDLTCNEIEDKCQEFFQQDFSQYGAVIVVVLTFEGGVGQLSALDGRFTESVILRHFTDDLNPTLVGKPKIYITEANKIPSVTETRLSLPLEDHQDILGLHFPTINHQTMVRRPIVLLCDNIKEMADAQDFVTILRKSVEEIQSDTVFHRKPIELSNNFTKEMMLAKSSE